MASPATLVTGRHVVMNAASADGLRSRKKMSKSASAVSSNPTAAEDASKIAYAALEKKRHDEGAKVRGKIADAIDATLERSRSRGADEQAAYDHVESEASKILDGVDKAIERDDAARSSNASVAKCEAGFSTIGILCLGFPILLAFFALCDVVLPPDFRDILAIEAQEDSLFGMTS
jgi:hypothetical protein